MLTSFLPGTQMLRHAEAICDHEETSMMITLQAKRYKLMRMVNEERGQYPVTSLCHYVRPGLLTAQNDESSLLFRPLQLGFLLLSAKCISH